MCHNAEIHGVGCCRDELNHSSQYSLSPSISTNYSQSLLILTYRNPTNTLSPGI